MLRVSNEIMKGLQMNTSVLLNQTAVDVAAVSPVAKDGTFFILTIDRYPQVTFYTVYRANDRHATPVYSTSTRDTMYPRDVYEQVMRYFRLRVGGLKHNNAIKIIVACGVYESKLVRYEVFRNNVWSAFDYMPAYLHVDLSEASPIERIA